MRATVIIAVLIAATATAAAAKSRQVGYVGIHPIPKSEGGGLCYIEAPHVHIYAADKVQYRDHRGDHYFVGDPVAYGYDGPKHVYKGHHPIHVHLAVGDADEDVEYCYLDGPHYHAFAEPEGPELKVVGGAYFYVGKPPAVYVDARPTYITINALYRPFVYVRPVVEVEPPEGWIGATVVVDAPGAVVVAAPGAAVVAAPGVRAGVGIRAGVEVHLPPPPSVRVEVGVGIGVGGGVIVKGKHKKKRHW